MILCNKCLIVSVVLKARIADSYRLYGHGIQRQKGILYYAYARLQRDTNLAWVPHGAVYKKRQRAADNKIVTLSKDKKFFLKRYAYHDTIHTLFL